MRRNEIHIKAHYCLCLLIAFFLPVYIHVVPVLIGLLTINWLVEGGFYEKLNSFKKNKSVWLFIAFYLFYLIGMLWTENIYVGGFDLQVKLSLLIFPLILSTTRSKTWEILLAFVYGCVLAGIICFVTATIHYVKTGENHFEYTFFSYVLHPTYFAMYIDFAIAVLIFSLNNHNPTRKEAVRLFAILFLTSIVILLASKTGTLLLAVIILLFAATQIFSHRKWMLGGAILLVSVSMFILAIKFFPYTINRIETSFHTFTHMKEITPHDSESMESNSERVLVWKSDLIAMKRNILIGTGTGDAEDELIGIYKEAGYTYLSEHQLNAHSQFFQSTITLGFFGGIILLLCFFVPVLISIRRKNFVYLVFLLVIIVNFSVESMLEVQAGVMFYAFFNSLLFLQAKTKPDS